MAAWRTRCIMTAALLTAASPLSMATRAAPSLDYEFFKARVQPVFLQKRDGHTRCYVCHAESNNAFRLEKIVPGESFWSDEQSRKNFESAASLVVPGDLAKSDAWERINSTDADEKMPPAKSEKKLKPEQIALLKK